MALGKILVVFGLLLVVVGALLWWGVPLGRLPGDVVVKRGAVTFYVPFTTCLLASVVITVALALLKR